MPPPSKFLRRDERLVEPLKQKQYATMVVNEMILLIYANINGLLDPANRIMHWEAELPVDFKHKKPELLSRFQCEDNLRSGLETQIKKVNVTFNKLPRRQLFLEQNYLSHHIILRPLVHDTFLYTIYVIGTAQYRLN